MVLDDRGALAARRGVEGELRLVDGDDDVALVGAVPAVAFAHAGTAAGAAGADELRAAAAARPAAAVEFERSRVRSGATVAAAVFVGRHSGGLRRPPAGGRRDRDRRRGHAPGLPPARPRRRRDRVPRRRRRRARRGDDLPLRRRPGRGAALPVDRLPPRRQGRSRRARRAARRRRPGSSRSTTRSARSRHRAHLRRSSRGGRHRSGRSPSCACVACCPCSPSSSSSRSPLRRAAPAAASPSLRAAACTGPSRCPTRSASRCGTSRSRSPRSATPTAPSSGRFEYHQVVEGESFNFNVDVTCFKVYDGNRAKIGGVIVNSTTRRCRPGRFAWFQVFDNGEGAGARRTGRA